MRIMVLETPYEMAVDAVETWNESSAVESVMI